jgi:hypothetical protein
MSERPKPEIENDRQYHVTQQCLRGFKRALAALDDGTARLSVGKGPPEFWRKLHRDALTSIIDELELQVDQYEVYCERIEHTILPSMHFDIDKDQTGETVVTPLDVIVHPLAVNEYLTKHNLESGYAPIEAVLMQFHQTPPVGQPQLMIVIEVDGKKVVAKTTLRLMEAAVSAMRAASGMDRDG